MPSNIEILQPIVSGISANDGSMTIPTISLTGGLGIVTAEVTDNCDVSVFVDGSPTPAAQLTLSPVNGIVSIHAREIANAVLEYDALSSGQSHSIHSLRIVGTVGGDSAEFLNLSAVIKSEYSTPSLRVGSWLSLKPQVSRTYPGAKEVVSITTTRDTISKTNPITGVTTDYNPKIDVQATCYLVGGSSVQITLVNSASTSGKAWMDIDVSPATIRTRLSSANRKNLLAYDIIVSLSYVRSTEPSAIDGVTSFNAAARRFILVPEDIYRTTFLFRNGYGAFDAIHISGDTKRAIDTEPKTFINSLQESEISNRAVLKYITDTGYLDSRELATAWLEFLRSSERYVWKDNAWQKIVIDEAETDIVEKKLSSLSFTWHYSDRVKAPDNVTYSTLNAYAS